MTAMSMEAPIENLLGLIPGYDPYAQAGDCHFDAEVAADACAFFRECLRHIEGAAAGSPLDLEPWQQAIVANLFGWKRPDGTRRYREALIYVPRKNGKTTLVAGLALYMLLCDGEPGAQVYSAAADRDQARIIFHIAKSMVLQEPELESRCKVYHNSITAEATNSSYKAISAEANTKHGYNVHCVIIDELHAQPNRELVDVLATATGARRQPLMIHVTTADYSRESICNEKYDYACKVRDNGGDPAKPGFDPAFLPVVYEAKLDDDWTSPEVWRKANPNLGVSISEEYLARECQRAKETPTYENTFKRLHLDMRTQQDVRWMPFEKWDACTQASDAVAWRRDMLEALRGQACYGGLDLSTTTDLTALALLFEREGGGLLALPFFWAPREKAEQREKRDRVPYLTWARLGFMKLTEGNVVDYDVVRADINALADRFWIKKIARDRWNATQITTQLMGDGREMIDFGQGFASMSAPTKELQSLILSGQIEHGANPMLRWCLGNCAAEIDAAENIKLSKKKSTDRIDGIIALVMALGMRLGSTDSMYDQPGSLSL